MEWIDIITKTAPVLAIAIAYFVHLETRLSNISTDLKWIKSRMQVCQQD